MMKTLITATMTSISEVMETMFFLPVEFGEETTFIQTGMDKNKPNMACQLNFSGDFSGHSTLVIPQNFLAEITESFMGESQKDLTTEHFEGTLTEILNMVCGNALSKIDSKKPFELDIPKVIDESTISQTQLFTIIETTQSKMAIQIAMD